MKILRALFLGVLIGAGIGAKVGALISNGVQLSGGFDLVAQGLLYGALIGSMLAIAIFYKKKEEKSY